MARTIYDWETNKNAVIIHYPHLYPYGPAYEGERPTGCVVQFLGYSISASIYEKGFRVFKNSENLSKLFPTLRDARQFIIDRVNKRRSFFNKR